MKLPFFYPWLDYGANPINPLASAGPLNFVSDKASNEIISNCEIAQN